MRKLPQIVALAALVAASATASADQGLGFGLEVGTVPVDTTPGDDGLCGGALFEWRFYLPDVTLTPRLGGCGTEHARVGDAELYVGHSWTDLRFLELFLTFDLGVVGGVSVVDVDGIDARVGGHGGLELGTTIDVSDPWTIGVHFAFQGWLPDDVLHPYTLRTLLDVGYRF